MVTVARRLLGFIIAYLRAVELIVAAKGQGDQRLVEETADLFYHVLVMLSFRGPTVQDVEAELRGRHRKATATQDR